MAKPVIQAVRTRGASFADLTRPLMIDVIILGSGGFGGILPGLLEAPVLVSADESWATRVAEQET